MKIIILFLLVFCYCFTDGRQVRDTDNTECQTTKSYEWDETKYINFISLFIEKYKKNYSIEDKSINIEIDYDETHALASVRNGILIISVDAAIKAILLAKLLSHDLFTMSKDHINLVHPIHPFATTPVIPLLPSIYDIESLNYFPFESLIPDQYSKQNYTFRQFLEVNLTSAIIGFVIAHEMAHISLGHEEKKKELSQEIIADKYAWNFLLSFLKEEIKLENENQQRLVELGFYAAPILLLEHLRANSFFQNETEQEADLNASEVLKRQNVLYSYMMDKKKAYEIKMLLNPKKSTNNIGKIQIQWDLTPDYLIINTVKIPIDEIKNHELLVAAGPLNIFAVAHNQDKKMFAYQKVSINNPLVITINLTFFRIADKEPDIKLVQELFKQEKWFDLWLLISNEEMEPKNQIFAQKHTETSIHLGLISKPLSQWE